MAESKVLLDKPSPVTGASYVEQLPTGEILAGRRKETTTKFANARAAYEHYLPLADGHHWAWNICYTLEDCL